MLQTQSPLLLASHHPIIPISLFTNWIEIYLLTSRSSCMKPFYLFFGLFTFWKWSCEAPEMFCGKQNFTWLPISMHERRWWLNLHFCVKRTVSTDDGSCCVATEQTDNMSRTETQTAPSKGSSSRWAHRLSVHVAAVGKVPQRQYLIRTKCKCEAGSCACRQSTYESRYAAGTQAVICHCWAEVITLLQRWLWSHRGDYNMTSWSGAKRPNINVL